MSRWLEGRGWLSAVAALVVAAVLLTAWWLGQPGSSAGTGVEPNGGAVPGWPGPDDASSRTAAPQPPVGREPRLSEGSVRIDSYVARDHRLLLTYTAGVPECYGEVVAGPVRERRRLVAVALQVVPPTQPVDSCIDLAITGTRAVDLSTPLGRRWVLDAGFVPGVPVRQAAHPYGPLDAGF